MTKKRPAPKALRQVCFVEVEKIPPSALPELPLSGMFVVYDEDVHGSEQTISSEYARLFKAGKTRYIETLQSVQMVSRSGNSYLPAGKFKVFRFSDQEILMHGKRVSKLSVAIGERLGMPDDELEDLSMAGLLHDVAIARLPDGLMNKAGQFTPEEFQLMSTHAEGAAEIIALNGRMSRRTRLYVLQHHERLDGSGYPFKLQGDSILLGSRILAVADVFDAITSSRPHRRALPAEAALNELRSKSGTQFDDRAVAVLCELMNK